MLKRLELVGFKSFNQKTALDFSKGITAIVGPNGSGKSNIIDALRWLLGEREARNLRGDKTEDLIFSGTNQKIRVGMAQATIHLDNSAQTLPVEFPEVAVSRRIYRDGTSEFLLNKSQVRLKDIVDFFAKSKLGTKGLTIINQGNGDFFVRASAAERREMMEEILGLRSYQLKKHEASLKLKNSQINLDKARVAIEELLPRLRLLRRQTGKWEKRTAFVSELKELEDKYFSLKTKELQKDFQDIDSAIRQIERQLQFKEKELEQLEKRVKEVENQKPQSARLNDRKFQLQRELGGLETQLKFASASGGLRLDLKDLLKLLKELYQEIDKLSAKNDLQQIQIGLNRLKEKINKSISPEDKKADSRREISEKIEHLTKELKNIEKVENEALKRFEEFNQFFRRAFESVSAKKDEIQQLQHQKNQILFKKDRWRSQKQDLEDKIRESGRSLNEFEGANISFAAADFDWGVAEKRMLKLRSELAFIGEIDQELVKEAEEAENRHRFLSGQISDLEKAVVDLTSLIKDLEIKIHRDFYNSLQLVNKEFGKYFRLLFGEGRARLTLTKGEEQAIDLDISLPSKGVKGLEALSGGEKSLLAIAALFALIAISPPPFLVFDEVDAALDEKNSQRFVNLVKKFAEKTQFVIATHNRVVMEAADVLYGVTMQENGTSRILSLRLT